MSASVWQGSGVSLAPNTYIVQSVISATAGQTVVPVGSIFSYSPGGNTIRVFVNGLIKIVDVDYTESSSTEITFLTPLDEDDIVFIVGNNLVPTSGDGGLRSDLASSGGGALVTVQATGTGAITRSLQEKLEELHRSIVDKGAVSSTTIDSTAAIQAVVDYHIANRLHTMYFPSSGVNYFRITDTITISGRLRIVGDGEFTTTIWADGFTAGQPIFNFTNAAIDVIENCSIEHMTIRSNNGNATGIRVSNLSFLDMQNIVLYNLYDGIEVTGTRAFSISARKVSCTQITNRGVRYHTYTGGGQHSYDCCTFRGIDGFLVEDTADLDSLAFNNCNWEQDIDTDFTCEGTILGLGVFSGRSEGLDGNISFNINPAAGKKVKGYIHQAFFWTSDSGNAYPIALGGDVEGFGIHANHSINIGFIAGVLLNGAGAAGVVSGNNFEDSPLAISAPRAGVVAYANWNSSGALQDYWGVEKWGLSTGTLTLTDSSGAGLSIACIGRWRKEGTRVSWRAQVIYPATADGSSAALTGFPYAIVSPDDVGRAGTAVYSNAGVALAAMTGFPNNTSLAILSSTALTAITNATLTGKTLYLWGEYETT